MPIEYVRDPRTGKLVPKGSLGHGRPVVPATPPRPRRPARPAPARPRRPTVWGFGPNGFSLNTLANDLRYELNQLRSDPVRVVERGANFSMRNTVAGIAVRQGSLGVTSAAASATRAAIELNQRRQGRAQTDYTTSPGGRAVDRIVDHIYRSAGDTPPSQMTPEQKSVDDMRSSAVLSMGGGLAVGLGLRALSGVRLIGPAAQALSAAMNPAGKPLLQGAASIAVDAAIGEAVTGPLDYTAKGGSALAFVELALGKKPGEIDTVQPGMAHPDAAAASFLPNVGFASLLGGTFAAIGRARSAQRAAQPVQQARAELEAAGLTQSEPESGASAFTPEAAQGAIPSLREANAALEEKYGIRSAEPAATPEPAPQPAAAPAQAMEPGGAVTPGKLPSADPAVDPWEIDYDPSLPEADVALTLVKNASDDELLNALRGDGALLDQLDQSIASRPPVEPDPALSTEVNGAPTASLAPPITPFADQWKRLGQKDPNALLAVLHPDVNPALAERAQAMFGRGWEDLTPQDAIDTLQAAAADGMTVMPNRLLPDQRIMLTGDIKRDPARFQYKGGTDARGVQRGSSLEGVDRWNSDMEGAVEVWQDPKDGNYYVVNGHNRLAKAQELGINSLLVREIIADSPEQAKTAGALSNIASGGGTPLDAAWFMKGAGIADPQQLESMGVPLSPTSGHGLSGFQLSRLPDDILRAVESGQIKDRMGRIIGGSGADEESMRAAYRYLVDNPGTTEGRLRGMLELSKQMGGQPQVGAAAEQTDLLKGTTWDQTFNKQMIAVADLADEVSTLLKREKRLFTMADANSAALEAKGSRIDKASAQQVADANARAIDFFQRTWMETGPIRDLLNEGGARVAAGENKGAVAKQIKNRLVGQLGDLMGEEAVVRTDAVQPDLLAQQPQQLAEVLPEDRPALELAAIQRAIQAGEVRPPETPIPDLPSDSGVDLLKVQRDLAENTITDDVVQALDDELALREQFGEIDRVVAQETEKAARDAVGYDLLTFEEKKQAGMLDGIGQPAAPAPRSFSFPADLAKSAPRYGMARVEFASDLDRAAYMLRDSSKKSKGEDRLVKALEEAGYSIPAIRTHGEKVKQALKDAVTEQTGSAAAPQSAMTLRVPEQKIDAGELDSPAGWDSLDSSPFKPDPQESLRRQEELRQIIREVAGDEVTIRFQDHYETVIKSPEWGGDGKATTTRGGFYRLLEDLIQVNGVMHDTLGHTGLAPSRVETAYHESFHRLQYIALSPEEASILNGNWARIKVGIGSGHLLVKKPIAYAESQAVAFQRYAAAKRAGADPVAAMLGSYSPDTSATQKALGFVVSAFDRILDVAEKLYNGLTKGTFDSTRAIFERARRGDLAQAENWEGSGGAINPGSGMDMMDRPASEYGWRRSSAFKEDLMGGGAGDLASPGPSPGQLFDELNSALGDPDPRTGMARGLSKSAVKQALNGDASRALSEGMQLAETRLSDLNARIEAIKQRAAQEGC